jgi:hypothetical protein
MKNGLAYHNAGVVVVNFRRRIRSRPRLFEDECQRIMSSKDHFPRTFLALYVIWALMAAWRSRHHTCLMNRRLGFEPRQGVRFFGKHSNAVVKTDLIYIVCVMYNDKDICPPPQVKKGVVA